MKDYIEDNKFLDKAIKKILETEFSGLDVEVEEIESKRRDGFIPDSANHGGYKVSRIIPQSLLYSASINEKVNRGLEESREKDSEMVAEEMKRKHSKELADWSLEKIRPSQLEEAGLDKIAREFEELEMSYGDEETVHAEVRIMYHGENEDKIHSFTVDSVINWNSPYHQDHRDLQSFQEEEVEGTQKEVVALVKAAVSKVGKQVKDALESF